MDLLPLGSCGEIPVGEKGSGGIVDVGELNGIGRFVVGSGGTICCGRIGDFWNGKARGHSVSREKSRKRCAEEGAVGVVGVGGRMHFTGLEGV